MLPRNVMEGWVGELSRHCKPKQRVHVLKEPCSHLVINRVEPVSNVCSVIGKIVFLNYR